MEKNCDRCGKSFECKENNSCWCLKESRLQQDQLLYADCVCKECLLLQYHGRLMKTNSLSNER